MVIGGGIMGLSIANKLAKSGFSMTVLEKDKIGMEGSLAAAGMLASQSEFEIYEQFMDFCIKSRDLYSDFCKEIENDSGIDVEYRKDGFIIPALNKEQEEILRKTSEWQKNKGFEIEFLSGNELKGIETNLSEDIISGLHIKNDAQVNNRKLMEALKIACNKNNVRIIENCEVKNYLLNNNKETNLDNNDLVKNNKIIGVETNNGDINADIVINCAGSWASSISPGLISNFEVKPILGQVVSLQADKQILKKVIFAIINQQGCYIVPRKDNEIIVGSTMEDVGFNKTIDENTINGLLKKAYELVPELKDLKIKEKWAGFRPTAKDNFPVIGKTNIENLILATAHSRNGILLAPITADAVKEIVLNGKVPEEIKDFGVERFSK